MLRSISGLLFGVCVAALGGCGAPTITSDDVVLAPGQAARFVMSLDRRFGKTSVPGVDVEFLVDGKPVAKARTDANGVAEVRAAVSGTPSQYEVRAKLGDQTLEGKGRIFIWDSNRTAVAIDVDETISATDYTALFLTDLDTTSQHMEYSPAAVRAISPHYEIVYLSARPRWLHEKTQVWLDEHGFPPGPILHASRFEACFRQEYYKREMLAEFQRDHPNLLIGVGDKGLDERAYEDNRMLGVILEKTSNGYSNGCVVLPDWQSVEQFLVEHRGSLGTPSRLRGVIHANGDDLRSFYRPPEYALASSDARAASPPQTRQAKASSPPTAQATASPRPTQRPTGATPRPSARPAAARGDWIYGYQ